MIKFKKNFEEELPYSRESYIEYLRDDSNSPSEWCGVSFQLNSEERELGLVKFFEFYEPLFKNVLSYFDNISKWIANHDYYYGYWFPNNENTIGSLRAVFNQNKIPYKFRGALIFEKGDLLEFSKDLLSYPFAMFSEEGLLYSNLDISNCELPFIIKISGHWNIDLLSTDKEFLRKIVDENSTDSFIVKQYGGTSLWS